jgi:propionyl-CoA carboxylase beta chain
LLGCAKVKGPRQPEVLVDKALVEDLHYRRGAAKSGGGEQKLQQQRDKGSMTARERLEALFEPASFMEWGLHARHRCHDFSMERQQLAADGVTTGIGYVGSRPVAAYSQDFTVVGGSLGATHATKIVDLMDHALKLGVPCVGFNDSGGARIQEGVDSLSGYGRVLALVIVPAIFLTP